MGLFKHPDWFITENGRPEWGAGILFGAFCALILMFAGLPVAHASSGGHEGAPKEETSSLGELIPPTVVELDKLVYTIVLPRNGMIRQMASTVYLELTDEKYRKPVEEIEPKIANAFLRDYQRYFYRDTEYRAENLEKGERNFRYRAPEMNKKPAPGLEQDGQEAKASDSKDGQVADDKAFEYFKPTTNKIIAGLQRRLMATINRMIKPDIVRSVQIRELYDQWPADRKPN